MFNLPAKRSNESWYPFREFDRLQREMNKLFDYSLPAASDTALFTSQWAPAIDVVDSKDNITVKADLPGLKREDIEVSVVDNILTIHGEKREEKEVKEKDYLRTERFHGSFHREIALPAGIDANKVNATFKDGVLELTLTKKEESKPKLVKIDVK